MKATIQIPEKIEPQVRIYLKGGAEFFGRIREATDDVLMLATEVLVDGRIGYVPSVTVIDRDEIAAIEYREINP